MYLLLYLHLLWQFIPKHSHLFKTTINISYLPVSVVRNYGRADLFRLRVSIVTGEMSASIAVVWRVNIIPAISSWLHRSALLGVRGGWTRPWKPGVVDHWEPFWRWLPQGVIIITAIFWGLILCQALRKIIFVYCHILLFCIVLVLVLVLFVGWFFFAQQPSEEDTIISPIFHWR